MHAFSRSIRSLLGTVTLAALSPVAAAAQDVVVPPNTPLPPNVTCDDLLGSEEGVLFGPPGTGHASPCTFPDKLPGDGVESIDPNDKVGAVGSGPGRFLTGLEPMRYAVFFENLETATAPAQEVVVTDRLDASQLDLGSFSLGRMGFADTFVTPPPGLSAFTTDVDLRPAQDLVVRITAGLDAATGVVTWSFVSLDPETGEPPEDPLAGFLPPNTHPPAGEGHVAFTIQPKLGLATDAIVCNDARIVFDANAAIVTSAWCNGIDREPPVTTPSFSPPPTADGWNPGDVTVSLAADDAGRAGVRRLTYEAAGAEPLAPTTAAGGFVSVPFSSEGVTELSFHAADLLGNSEATRHATIRIDRTPPHVACPPPVVLAARDGGQAAVPDLTADVVASDNLTPAPALAVVQDPAPGTPAGTGTHAIGLTVTDLAGNASTCATELRVTAAADGAIAFVSSRDGSLDIHVMDADGGNPRRLTSHPAADTNPAWSPDRTRIAFSSTRAGNPEIYVMNADGSGQTRLTASPGIDEHPTWSPDGTRIAFWSTRGGNPAIYVMDADGGRQTRLTSHAGADVQPAWSPDGTRIAFARSRRGGLHTDIYTMRADGTDVTRLTATEAAAGWPAWSPDGTRIAFAVRRGLFGFQVWVIDADGSGASALTTGPHADLSPCWSRDGASILVASNRDGARNFEIYSLAADGTSPTRLTTQPGLDLAPSW